MESRQGIYEEKIYEEMNERVMNIFKEICEQIPRGSKKEDTMCEYLEKFVGKSNAGFEKNGQDIELEYIYEKEYQEGKPINNVIIKKPASKGYEDLPPVALQSHLDMVCQKTENSTHNFDAQVIETEEIDMDINKNQQEKEDLRKFIVSKGRETTLGADDGIGVACMLAILEDGTLFHPRIEAVFTSDEEDGMSGAKWLNIDQLESKRFINIDAEEEGTFFTGCAGGVYVDISIPAIYRPIPEGCKLFKVEISGLLGGHSGLKIGERHANANRLIGRTVNYLKNEFARLNSTFLLVDLYGGDAKNAITKKATAVVAIDEKNEGDLKELLYGEDNPKSVIKIFQNEYCGVEDKNNFKVTVIDCADEYKQAVSEDTLKKIITAILTVPNGVLDMHTNNAKLVETSSNLGIMSFAGGMFKLNCFVRSFLETKKLFVVEQMRMIAESIGAGFDSNTDFPEWNPNDNSELLKLFHDTYRDVFKKDELGALSVHAGLECGYFYKKYEAKQIKADLIAVGPTIWDAHVPTEALQKDTVKRIIMLLVNVLANMKSDGKLFAMSENKPMVFDKNVKDCTCNCMV